VKKIVCNNVNGEIQMHLTERTAIAVVVAFVWTLILILSIILYT